MNRPTAAQRGYDARWRRVRRGFLRANPVCIDCGAAAVVPDHDPVDRKTLVAQGAPDPDAFHHLKPRCISCHNARTAREQPGGWAQKGSRRRPAAPHPGLQGGGGTPLPPGKPRPRS